MTRKSTQSIFDSFFLSEQAAARLLDYIDLDPDDPELADLPTTDRYLAHATDRLEFELSEGGDAH